MRLRRVLPAFAAAFLVLAGSSYAADTGVYLQVTGGYTMPDDALELREIENDQGNPTAADVDFTLDNGSMGALALGYDWGSFRAEGELSFRENSLDGTHLMSGYSTPADGDFQATSFMGNAIYELPVNDVVSFYIGAGAGVAVIDADPAYGTGYTTSDYDIETSAFAYQGLAGMEVNLTDHLALNFGYRLWSCMEADFDDSDLEFWVDAGDETTFKEVDGDMTIPLFHTLEVGLRYTF